MGSPEVMYWSSPVSVLLVQAAKAAAMRLHAARRDMDRVFMMLSPPVERAA
jgi:hypothetical protein